MNHLFRLVELIDKSSLNNLKDFINRQEGESIAENVEIRKTRAKTQREKKTNGTTWKKSIKNLQRLGGEEINNDEKETVYKGVDLNGFVRFSSNNKFFKGEVIEIDIDNMVIL